MNVQIIDVLSSMYLLERISKWIHILGFVVALLKNNWIRRKKERKKERKGEKRESTQKPSEKWKKVKGKDVPIQEEQ
jgi:hypothetical protein